MIAFSSIQNDNTCKFAMLLMLWCKCFARSMLPINKYYYSHIASTVQPCFSKLAGTMQNVVIIEGSDNQGYVNTLRYD